jgi:hypothetical protein
VKLKELIFPEGGEEVEQAGAYGNLRGLQALERQTRQRNGFLNARGFFTPSANADAHKSERAWGNGSR